jgi:tetratricopeptide (TPR) repeat protein
VFSWSYRQLSMDAARMFRLLGLHPGPDISGLTAASLAGAGEAEARRVLRELARAHLITEHVPGRYAFHDLLRAYADAKARDTDSEPEREAAVGRILDHYLHTASQAALLLHPVRDLIALAPPSPGAVPEPPADHRQALTWFEAEHQVLLAAVTLADSSGSGSHAWQLPWAMEPFLQHRGHYQEWAATQRTALAAATRAGHVAGQAVSSCLLASAYDDLQDYDQALGYYASSLRLYQRLGNRFGQANVHQNLGLVAEHQGRYADAFSHAKQALRLYEAISHKGGEAIGLNYVGWCHGLLGDYRQAHAYCRRSLAICAEAGYRRSEGHAWDSLGYTEHHLGNLAEAVNCYKRALAIARELGDRWVEADTLTHLGDTRHAADDLPKAREAWLQALAILKDIQHPDAAKVRAKLSRLDAESPPSRGRERLHRGSVTTRCMCFRIRADHPGRVWPSTAPTRACPSSPATRPTSRPTNAPGLPALRPGARPRVATPPCTATNPRPPPSGSPTPQPGSPRGAGGYFAAFEAEEFVPFGVGGCPVLLGGSQGPAAGEECQVGADCPFGVDGLVALVMLMSRCRAMTWAMCGGRPLMMLLALF